MTTPSATSHARACPVCTRGRLEPFLDVGMVPVHVGAIWSSRAEAVASPRGRMLPAFCQRCGLVYNVGFEPGLLDYHGIYDNALHFSGVFREYEEGLARQLVERNGLRGKLVVEVGCGSGHFLELLCTLGGNRGLGFDPSHDPAKESGKLRERVRYEQRTYGGEREEAGDLLCSRHMLEHVPDPLGVLASFQAAMRKKPASVMYCEVPSANFVLGRPSIWDLIYEHCSYFFPAALACLARRAGFDVHSTSEDYDGQFLSIEARPGRGSAAEPLPTAEELAAMSRTVRSFTEHFEDARRSWRERLAQMANEGGKAVLWGAGAKTVQFACLVGEDAPIDYVVDINPGKQGSFLAGSGWPVHPPEVLRREPPALVILPNPIYEQEIRQSLAQLGVSPAVATL